MPTKVDFGKSLKVQVSFYDNYDSRETLTSPLTAPVQRGRRYAATGSPVITGTVQMGETLSVNTSGISDRNGIDRSAFTYQWISNDGTADTDIQDATGSTYTLAAADEGKTIEVRVSFTDDGGNQETRTSAVTVAVAARPNSVATGAPAISGMVQVGQTLTASTSDISDSDGLANAIFTYQWIANDGTEDTDIQNATGSTYTLAAADEGKTIKVRVSFTDDRGEPGDAYERRYRSSIRQRRADQPDLHLPMAVQRRRQRLSHLWSEQFHVHAGAIGRGKDHPGSRVLH